MGTLGIGLGGRTSIWATGFARTALGVAALALVIGACGRADEGSTLESLARSDRDDRGWTAGDAAAYEAPAAEMVEEEAAAPLPADMIAGASVGLDVEPSSDDAVQESTAPQEGSAPPSAGIRRIIKDGILGIRVEDVPLGIARLETIAAQSGGYVIETATDYRDRASRKATVKMAVPVDGFEAALERIRQAAQEVISESASGTDVSGEVVDLRAQIANLEATSARVRAFLDQANTVEEALQVNAQLTELEGDIAERKGRLEYLEQRSAYSTITVSLSEPTPDWTPTTTATPSATMTPAPTATPVPWEPGETVRDATDTVQRMLRGLAELVIWLVIVGLPFVLIAGFMLAAITWVLRRVGGRRGGGP